MAATGPSPRPEPVNLIIDSDPGCDDILAFILALSQPHVNLLAISLTFGNTTLDYAQANVLRLFNVLHRQWKEAPDQSERARWDRIFDEQAKTIELSLGAEGPLGGRQRFTASYFHGRDGLSSVAFLPDDPFPLPLPPPGSASDIPKPSKEQPFIPHPLKLSSLSSADLLLDQLAKNPPGSIRIAAIGPLTNLALAWRKDPATFARVGLISVMGGALDEPGNTAPCSEFNIYADPWAAKVLFEESVGHESLKSRRGQRLPIELLPLDITGRHTVPYSRLMGRTDTPLGQFIGAMLAHPRKMTNSFVPRGQPFDPARDDLFQAHDPLAVAHVCFASQGTVDYHADPSSSTDEWQKRSDHFGWSYQERRFLVESEGEVTRGMCVVDRRLHGISEGKRAGKSRAKDTESYNESTVEGATARGIAHPISSTDPEQQTNGSATSNGVEHDEEGVPGLISVVTDSPGTGSEWFAELFCASLGV